MATRPRSQIKAAHRSRGPVRGQGEHSDGLGLLLRVHGDSASGFSAYTSPNGRRREMGLGACQRTSRRRRGSQPRPRAGAGPRARALLLSGTDPIDHREAQRVAARAEAEAKKLDAKKAQLTLLRAARDYHERVIEPSRSAKHSAQWIASIEGPPADDRTDDQAAGRAKLDILLAQPIDEVSAPELLDAIIELRQRTPETADRVVQRLAAVFDDCQFRGTCRGNPARAIRKKLSEAGRGRSRGQLAALPYREAPAFMRELGQRQGIAARALEFAVLTASRTGEVVGATWPEFDLDEASWVVPAARMKGGEEHRVHLTARAVEILKAMQALKQPYVFPNPRLDGEPLSNMAMLTVLQAHGCGQAHNGAWARTLDVQHMGQRDWRCAARCDRGVSCPS